MSGGEQQRVAIARAMVSHPDILIFDEPTASLDGDTGRRIMAFVKTHILNEKRCILIVTHDSRIFEYADRIMRMEDGAVTGIENNTHAGMKNRIIFIASGIGVVIGLASAFCPGW